MFPITYVITADVIPPTRRWARPRWQVRVHVRYTETPYETELPVKGRPSRRRRYALMRGLEYVLNDIGKGPYRSNQARIEIWP